MKASPGFLLLRHMLAERPAGLLAGALLAALASGAGIALLGLSGWFITGTALAGLSAATALAFDVFSPAAAIRFLALLRTGARYGERLTTHAATLCVLAALRERLFRGFAGPDAAAALRERPGRLLFRLTADVDALDGLYPRLLLPLVLAALAAAGSGVLLGLVAGPLAGTLPLMLLAGVLLAAGMVLAVTARPTLRRARALETLRERSLALVAGQSDLAMTGRLAAQQQAIGAAEARLAAADSQINRSEVLLSGFITAAGAALLAGLLLLLAPMARAGTLSAPLAALALLVAVGLMDPLQGLRRGIMDAGRMRLAARRLAPRLAPHAESPAPPLPPAGFAVVAHDLAVRHEAGALPAIAGLSLAIAAGERVALVGASGAGKSTLLAALAGDGTAVPEGGLVSLPALRLGQHSALFRDSLAENLRLAAPDATDAALDAALARAGLATTVAALPAGRDTLLGEGGQGLSAGQARRLALARLLLRDAPLWLLDEPTEALDATTARTVLESISDLAQGKTLVVATHMRREAAITDRIIVLEKGRLAGDHRRGTPGFATALAALRADQNVF